MTWARSEGEAEDAVGAGQREDRESDKVAARLRNNAEYEMQGVVVLSTRPLDAPFSDNNSGYCSGQKPVRFTDQMTFGPPPSQQPIPAKQNGYQSSSNLPT